MEWHEHVDCIIALLSTTSDFKRHAHEVRGDGGVVPWSDVQLGVRRLGANLQIGVAKGVANGVNANEGAGAEEIDSLKITSSRGVELCPLAVDVLRQELQRVDRLLRGAAGRQSVHCGAGPIRRSVLYIL